MAGIAIAAAASGGTSSLAYGTAATTVAAGDASLATVIPVATVGVQLVAHFDLSALTVTDRVVVTAKTRLLSGGTNVAVWIFPFEFVQAHPFVEIPIPAMPDISGYIVDLIYRQDTGTTRSVPWKILQYT